MTSFLIAFISLAFLLGAFAYLAVPAGSPVRRAVIAGLFAVILGALFFGYSDMLGRPKSTRLEVFRAGMQDAIAENERQHGSGVGMGLPFERSWDREDPKFYALPQPKLPDKPGERPPVTVYQAPEQGA